jgi:tubulin beta
MHTICSEIPLWQSSSITSSLVCNTTSIVQPLQRIAQQFDVMFRRKSFLYFRMEGMDEMVLFQSLARFTAYQEFAEAQSNLHDLIREYEDYQNVA